MSVTKLLSCVFPTSEGKLGQTQIFSKKKLTVRMLMNASVFISHTSQHFVMIMVVIAQQLLTDKQQIIWLYKVSQHCNIRVTVV